jgi:hypothetical protein
MHDSASSNSAEPSASSRPSSDSAASSHHDKSPPPHGAVVSTNSASALLGASALSSPLAHSAALPAANNDDRSDASSDAFPFAEMSDSEPHSKPVRTRHRSRTVVVDARNSPHSRHRINPRVRDATAVRTRLNRSRTIDAGSDEPFVIGGGLTGRAHRSRTIGDSLDLPLNATVAHATASPRHHAASPRHRAASPRQSASAAPLSASAAAVSPAAEATSAFSTPNRSAKGSITGETPILYGTENRSYMEAVRLALLRESPARGGKQSAQQQPLSPKGSSASPRAAAAATTAAEPQPSSSAADAVVDGHRYHSPRRVRSPGRHKSPRSRAKSPSKSPRNKSPRTKRDKSPKSPHRTHKSPRHSTKRARAAKREHLADTLAVDDETTELDVENAPK